MNKLNLELGNFIKDYSIKNYKEDYKVKCDLSYKYVVKKDIVWRKWISRLKKYLNKNNIFCDGFVVSEYDRNLNSLHNHLLIYSDVDYYILESKIYNYWKNIGSLKVEKYNRNQNYSSYLVKHLNKTNNNNWEFLSLL
jgi:5S rRNA maturation endonuclease (ribonuclease M5)